MVEMLFVGGQIASLAGLLYGGWLCITNAGCGESNESARHEWLASREQLTWQHYLAWDA